MAIENNPAVVGSVAAWQNILNGCGYPLLQITGNLDSPTLETTKKFQKDVGLKEVSGVDLKTCSAALKKYEGIYRRHQVLGNKNGIWVIDDFAHNPVKCAAAMEACTLAAPSTIRGTGSTNIETLTPQFLIVLTTRFKKSEFLMVSHPALEVMASGPSGTRVA